ncbi:hypothetical protein [Flavobacterium frigidimaris]|nr:hypothetical protein [Flavobacterium frigidimaris]
MTMQGKMLLLFLFLSINIFAGEARTDCQTVLKGKVTSSSDGLVDIGT